VCDSQPSSSATIADIVEERRRTILDEDLAVLG
jgi:hypothetical protein